MPPEARLPDEAIADLVAWVKMGAPDPRSVEVAIRKGPIDFDQARQAWAFQPPKASSPPAVKNLAWPRSDVDRFILARLEREGLLPVADADRRTLIRRVTFDLTGLPPTPEDVEAFVNDPQPDAFERVVDRLLASPRFGERWGRHWLDVARYAESTGMERNQTYPFAWRFRDYVIDAFNADKPYDQFLREQIAGDLLASDDPATRNERIIATGFLAIGPKGLNERNAEKYAMDVVDDQIDATCRAILGLTVSCARCHDHKFDPIPTTDYYALAGIFRSTETLAGVRGGRNGANVGGMMPLAETSPQRDQARQEHEAVVAALQAQVAETQRQVASLGGKAEELPAEAKSPAAKAKQPKKPKPAANPAAAKAAAKAAKKQATETQPPKPAASSESAKGDAARSDTPAGDTSASDQPKDENSPDNEFQAAKIAADRPKKPENAAQRAAALQEVQARLKELQAKLKELTANPPPPPDVAMGVHDAARPADLQVLIRGEVGDRGPRVPRGLITVACNQPVKIPESDSGRLELANWLASRENPLTARVAVNRVWHYLFGAGIVASTDNFGALGEKPTHPELLDTLAVQFMDQGWSIKKLIRSLVLTRTYQLSSVHSAANYTADPENRLQWRHARRRMEAEEIRDAVLAVSGQLSLDRPAGSKVQRLGQVEVGRNANVESLAEDQNCRSVYLPLIRGAVPEMLRLFDAADPELVVSQRDATTVPAQALFMLNSPFMMAQAQHLAQRLLALDQNSSAGTSAAGGPAPKAQQEAPSAAEARAADARRIDAAYRLALGRPATDIEQQRVAHFLAEARTALGNPADDTAAWAGFCQALMASAEFRTVY
jgi:hypothetical protein